MKWLTDRKEIAKAINIDHIPVITMNIRKCMDGYENCYEGSRINLEGAYKGKYADLLTHCTARMYGDEEGNQCHDEPWRYARIHLTPRNACLSSSFSLHDVDEMVDWSNAPKAKANDLVIVYFRAENEGYIRLMKIGSRIDPHCTTATMLEDID